jgi:hypothetical protein
MLRSAEGARLARSTGAMGGLIVIVLGLWGALIPFVGPYFGYGFGAHASWHYSDNRLWLDILPGVVAVLAGAMMLGAVTRRTGLFAGGLGLAAGAWFVVGPSVAVTWEHGAIGPIGAPIGGHTRQMLEYVGFFYGVGGLIVALVAFASGRFLSRPLLADAPVAINAYRGARFGARSYDDARATPPSEAAYPAGNSDYSANVPGDAAVAIAAYRGARFDAANYDDARATSTSEGAYPASTSDSAEVPAYGDATPPVTPAPSQTSQRTQRGWLRAAMAPLDHGPGR